MGWPNEKDIERTLDVLNAVGHPELAEVVSDLWSAAQLDHVTGLYNRATFEQLLDYERQRAIRYGRDLSLLILDIDDFKEVNDRLGHLAGDDVLRCVASNLRRSARSTDVAARVGGDEFALILPETPAEATEEAAERIRETLDGLDVVARGGTTRTSVTVGMATLAGSEPWSRLFDRADQELMERKRSRRAVGHSSRAR